MSAEDRELTSMQERVFLFAALGGNTKRALAEVSPHLIPDVLFNKHFYMDGYYTPLVIAARYNNMKAVLVLLDYQDKFCGGEDLKNRSNGNTFEALFEAANNDHLAIVETLLWSIDVNGVDCFGQTALHSVRRCGKDVRPVIEYLISNGAKVDIPDAKGETCLFNACREANADVVDLLLSKGADPNHRSLALSTPLHAAATRRDCAVAKLLIERGARLSRDRNGYSPLVLAALRPSSRFVDFFVTLPECSRKERIEALELLGAVISRYDPASARAYLRIGLEERYRDPADILLKDQRPPVADLGGVVESQTPEELDRLQRDRQRLMLEGVLVLERILGEAHKQVAVHCDHICRALLEAGRFGEALTVWKYSRKHSIYVENLSNLDKHVHLMVCAGLPPSFPVYHDVVHLALQEMEVQAGAAAQDRDYLHCAPGNVRLCVRYIAAALPLASTDGDLGQLKAVTSRLIQVAPQFARLSVIHIALSLFETQLRYGRPLYPRDSASFLSFIALLVECGADASGKDEDKKTPLHRVCKGVWRVQTHAAFTSSVARLLLEVGAEVDARDAENRTPLDWAVSEKVRAVLLEHHPLSLKSLAASALVQHRVPYQGLLPSAVERFVLRHESC